MPANTANGSARMLAKYALCEHIPFDVVDEIRIEFFVPTTVEQNFHIVNLKEVARWWFVHGTRERMQFYDRCHCDVTKYCTLLAKFKCRPPEYRYLFNENGEIVVYKHMKHSIARCCVNRSETSMNLVIIYICRAAVIHTHTHTPERV